MINLFNIYSYQNFSKNFPENKAVAIFCFNRPFYLKRCLDSIETNPESSKLPFFFFLDGGPKSKQAVNRRVISRSKIKHKFIIERPDNFGIPKNIIDARRLLFDHCNFETVVIMEEDLIINNSFFSLLFKLHDWAHTNYTNIGTIQLWNEYCLLDANQKKEKLDILKQPEPWWSGVCYTQTKNVWSKIREFLYEYESLFIDSLVDVKTVKYARSKPSRGPFAKEIKEWLRNQKKPEFKIDPKTIVPDYTSKILEHIYNPRIRNGNQDCINAIALWLNGYVRLQTLVNHGVHIGAVGTSSTLNSWKKSIGSKLELENYRADELPDQFIVL